MAVRGARVVVPCTPENQRYSFVPSQLAKDLEMILVENEDQLLAVLSDHQPGKPQLDKTTDLDDVVAIIDGDFQKSLNEKRG